MFVCLHMADANGLAHVVGELGRRETPRQPQHDAFPFPAKRRGLALGLSHELAEFRNGLEAAAEQHGHHGNLPLFRVAFKVCKRGERALCVAERERKGTR